MSGPLFVSLNPKNPLPVSRWGSRVLIAAERDPVDRRKIHYFPERVVAIPAEEYRRYRSEYNDALKAGDLLRRSENDHKASLKAEEKEQEKLQTAAKKRRSDREKKPEEVANGTVETDRTGD